MIGSKGRKKRRKEAERSHNNIKGTRHRWALDLVQARRGTPDLFLTKPNFAAGLAVKVGWVKSGIGKEGLSVACGVVRLGLEYSSEGGVRYDAHKRRRDVDRRLVSVPDILEVPLTMVRRRTGK